MINRRQFCLAAIGAGIATTGIASAAPITPTIVPLATPAATPMANPDPELEKYTGDLNALWEEPWSAEGKLLSFQAVIIQRMIAPEGQGISVSNDEMVFRSLLHVDIPTLGDLFVASNDDLNRLGDAKTVDVTGIYGGMHGPGWRAPLVIARTIEPGQDD